MRLPARRTHDADVIRARLRALLAEGSRPGWIPDEPQDAPDPDSTDDDDEEEQLAPEGGVGRHRPAGAAVRVDPGRPGARALWAAALGAVVVLLLWTWLQRPTAEPAPVRSAPEAEDKVDALPSQTPASSAPVGEAADSSTTVVVSVVGLVAEPGLVTLAAGSRVADAVDAAGGLLPDADAASVNLAAVVGDGQQVAVGVPAAPGAASSATAAPAAGGAVNLNTADVGALDGLPGIGPVLAQRIVDHRAQGPFRQVDDLLDVPGIGPAILARLADAVTV